MGFGLLAALAIKFATPDCLARIFPTARRSSSRVVPEPEPCPKTLKGDSPLHEGGKAGLRARLLRFAVKGTDLGRDAFVTAVNPRFRFFTHACTLAAVVLVPTLLTTLTLAFALRVQCDRVCSMLPLTLLGSDGGITEGQVCFVAGSCMGRIGGLACAHAQIQCV